MTRKGFEHRRTDMAELTYSHYMSPDTYVSLHVHTPYYNLYINIIEKGHL